MHFPRKLHKKSKHLLHKIPFNHNSILTTLQKFMKFCNNFLAYRENDAYKHIHAVIQYSINFCWSGDFFTEFHPKLFQKLHFSCSQLKVARSIFRIPENIKRLYFCLRTSRRKWKLYIYIKNLIVRKIYLQTVIDQNRVRAYEDI